MSAANNHQLMIWTGTEESFWKRLTEKAGSDADKLNRTYYIYKIVKPNGETSTTMFVWRTNKEIDERIVADTGIYLANSGHLTLDTKDNVFFYEQEFYPLSNFSSFSIEWKDELYPTSEHVYHSEKVLDPLYKKIIREARSADEAYRLSYTHKEFWRDDWFNIRVSVMFRIIKAKVRQHFYVKKKLLDTGDRILIENSWRDDFWGWGPNKNGRNELGRLWMMLRDDVRSSPEVYLSRDEDRFNATKTA